MKKISQKKQSSDLLSKKLRYVVAVFALAGLVLSLYLLRDHFQPAPSFCDINARVSCAAVNASSYSVIFGIPVALIGAIHYAALLLIMLFLASLVRLLGVDEKTLYALLLVELSLGVLFSGYLTAIEAFVLKTYCPLCLFSAGLSVASLIIVAWLWRRSPEGHREY